jgi:hypothetical protein
MSNDPRAQVEDRHAHDGVRTARNMPDAANAEQSLQGYAAVNDAIAAGDSDIARRAYELYQQRQQAGEPGSADDDWFRAEREVRSNRSALNA